MKYMAMVRSAEGQSPPPALMEAIGELAAEAAKAGVLVTTGGLMSTATALRVRIKGGKLTVTDGPFTEAKEVIGGYAIYDVASRDEVVEWTRRFMELHRTHWPEWEGEAEVREMFEASLLTVECGQG